MRASTIHIARGHDLPDQDVRDAAQRVAEKLARDFNARYEWKDDSVVFDYSSLHGVIRMEPGQVDVEIKLGLLLRPLRGRIEKGVAEALDEVLSTTNRRA